MSVKLPRESAERQHPGMIWLEAHSKQRKFSIANGGNSQNFLILPLLIAGGVDPPHCALQGSQLGDIKSGTL